MPIPPKYRSLIYKLDELKRKASYLDSEVSWETLADFALVGYHLCDWVEEDKTVSEGIKTQAKALKNEKEIQACRDIANKHKHRELNKYPKKHPPQTKEPNVVQGFGAGRYGKGGWGVGEEQITIEMTDGSVSYDALELVRKVVKLWEDFFDRHGLR